MAETLGERVLARRYPPETEARFSSPADLAAYCTAGKELNPAHLQLVDQAFLDIANGDCNRVLLTMPPRHGKTRRASQWAPAWYLHRFPERRVILASYEADFASTHGRRVRDIIEEHDLGIKVSKESSAAHRWDLAGHDGGMMTAGVGGPITGKGAHLLIIDDPIKNAEEANSPVMRDKQWDWFLSTALTRLEPGGAIILILTRWHEDDLAGRLLRQEGSGWRCINLPALAEDDDPLGREPDAPLWPERYDKVALEAIRATQGSFWWSSLYQQHPTPLEGGLFKKAWFRYWQPIGDKFRLGDRILADKDCWRFATVDLAASTKTTADWTVVCSWMVTYDGDLCLLDMERARVDETQHIALVRRQVERHNLPFVCVESRMFGSTLVYAMGRQGIHFRELKADTDKVTRAFPASVRMENGHLWLPQGHQSLDIIESELLGFPNASHDDVTDCVSYAAQWLAKFGHGRKARERYFPKTREEEFWRHIRADLDNKDSDRSPRFVGME